MDRPSKVLITGGHEAGGLSAFAEALSEGFRQIGIPSEVISPRDIWSRWRELRSQAVLKILSTTAVFAAPFARRTICVAHGFPYPDLQGWGKVFGFIGSYKLANAFEQVRFVSVSDYLAVHLKRVYNVRVDAVIRNPVLPVFEEAFDHTAQTRNLITYVGRLVPSKGLDRLLPAIGDLVDETPQLRAWVVGDGESRRALENTLCCNPGIEFKGSLSPGEVRSCLRETRVFVSGNPVEPLGIAYLEALTQGCVVAMPACGGGLEIAPDLVGGQIQLLPISLRRHEVLSVLRRSLSVTARPRALPNHNVKAVASAYLRADARRIGSKCSGHEETV